MAFKIEGNILYVDDEAYEILHKEVEEQGGSTWTYALMKDYLDQGNEGEYFELSLLRFIDLEEDPAILFSVSAYLNGIPGSIVVDFFEESAPSFDPVEFYLFNKACSMVSNYTDEYGDWSNYVKGYPDGSFA